MRMVKWWHVLVRGLGVGLRLCKQLQVVEEHHAQQALGAVRVVLELNHQLGTLLGMPAGLRVEGAHVVGLETRPTVLLKERAANSQQDLLLGGIQPVNTAVSFINCQAREALRPGTGLGSLTVGVCTPCAGILHAIAALYEVVVWLRRVVWLRNSPEAPQGAESAEHHGCNSAWP